MPLDHARSSTAAETVNALPLALIAPSPFNQRANCNAEDLAQLAQSMAEAGLQQPIVVRTHAVADAQWQLVFGHRRAMAARQLGWETIPALIRELSDEQVLIAQTIENLQRENLSPLDEARGYRQLLDTLGVKVESIVERVGKSRTQIYARLRLLDLHPDVLGEVQSGRLQAEVAQLLARQPQKDQPKLAFQLLGGQWHEWDDADLDDVAEGAEALASRRALLETRAPLTFRAARELLEEHSHPLAAAKFDLAVTNYGEDLPALGAARAVRGVACGVCPYRSGNQPGYEDNPDVCLDTACFESKERAESVRRHSALVIAGAKPIKSTDEWKARQRISQGELIDLARRDPAIDKKRPLRDVLGEHLAGATLIGQPGSSALQVAMTPTALAAALKKAGIDKASSLVEKAIAKKQAARSAADYEGGDTGASAWEVRRKKALAFAANAQQAICEAVARQAPQPGDLLLIAEYMLGETGYAVNQDDVLRAVGARDMNGCDSNQLAAVCVIALALAGLDTDTADGAPRHEPATETLCSRYGVDLAALHAEAWGTDEAAPARKGKGG